MIPEPVLLILAASFGVTCGTGVVLSLRDHFDNQASHRRCREARHMAEIEIAKMFALKTAPENYPVAAALTAKIVPIRPDHPSA